MYKFIDISLWVMNDHLFLTQLSPETNCRILVLQQSRQIFNEAV